MGRSPGVENRYTGLTKKQYKRKKAQEGSNSEPGINKGKGCTATGLEKALTKYPRHYRTNEKLYTANNARLDKIRQETSLSGGTKRL